MKTVLGGESIALNAGIRKERSKISHLSFHLGETRKRGANKIQSKQKKRIH